jgi:putative inorganic carbon (hco3(-)) transporter
MVSSQKNLQLAAFYFIFASAVADLVSIFACHTLLIAAIVATLLARQELRVPPIKLPFGLFIAGTLLALLLSDNTRAGFPQFKKLFVFSMLFLAYTLIRRVPDIRRLVLWWTAAATVQSLWSYGQYVRKVNAARALHVDFYTYYVSRRITGFLGHWMPFSAVQMMALLMLISLLFFAPPRDRRAVIGLWFCGLLIAYSILLSETRSIWAATAVGAAFLVWKWKPKMVLAVPVILGGAFLAAPHVVKERVISIYKPHGRNGETDSNRHRQVTYRVGFEMIKAHPWFGLGPEMPGIEFQKYVPPEIRPLPDGYYGHLHSIYTQYAAERGIPTALCMMWLLGKILFDFLRALRTSIDPYIAGGVAVVIGILIEGIVEYNLGTSPPLGMFLAVVAIGYSAIAARCVEAADA